MLLAYCRVSTKEQGPTSLPEQERRLRGLAKMLGVDRNFEFQLYSDDGVSGAMPLSERPAGARLMADACPGDTICAAKLDRLFRSASDALVTVDALKKRGVKVILLDIAAEPVTENGVAKLFFTILSAVAEFERGRIAERTADGRRAKKEKGGHLGGFAPYGFRVEGSERESRLVPVPEEQAVVAAIGQPAGKSPWKVAKKLERMGFRTRSGRPFQTVQVQRIMERMGA